MIYTKHSTRTVDKKLKRNLTMSLDKYIDICLIDEYADKNHIYGWSLDIDSLPQNEIDHLLDKLMQDDTAVRDYVRYSMQTLIDARLSICEANNKLRTGLSKHYLSNGDSILVRKSA